MQNIPKWLQRCMIEYIELEQRVQKIEKFIDTQAFDNLDINQQQLLYAQYTAMQTYQTVLNMRIESNLPEDFDGEDFEFDEDLFGEEESEEEQDYPIFYDTNDNGLVS